MDQTPNSVVLELTSREMCGLYESRFGTNPIRLNTPMIRGRAILKRKGTSESSKILVDGAELTLDCMGSLCAILLHFGMDKEMCWLYERLAEEVCQLEELRQLVTSGKDSASKKSLSTLLNRSDAKAIDLILTGAVQCGSLANNVWKYVVRCVEYVSELERYLFQLIKQQTNFDTSSVSETHVSLRDLLSRCPQHELSASTMGKVLDELLLEIDSFFEKAPAKLSLPSLCTLLEALITANENNLKYSNISLPPVSLITTLCIFLQRMNQLVCGVKDRHLMRTWTSVKDHLVEVCNYFWKINFDYLFSVQHFEKKNLANFAFRQ
ncbi:hypothetical protein Ddc_13841 [Ditylenchus destructor]|nr:hypothetical protein Ddc_13841 [Ditylenchus destructor]